MDNDLTTYGDHAVKVAKKCAKNMESARSELEELLKRKVKVVAEESALGNCVLLICSTFGSTADEQAVNVVKLAAVVADAKALAACLSSLLLQDAFHLPTDELEWLSTPDAPSKPLAQAWAQLRDQVRSKQAESLQSNFATWNKQRHMEAISTEMKLPNSGVTPEDLAALTSSFEYQELRNQCISFVAYGSKMAVKRGGGEGEDAAKLVVVSTNGKLPMVTYKKEVAPKAAAKGTKLPITALFAAALSMDMLTQSYQ